MADTVLNPIITARRFKARAICRVCRPIFLFYLVPFPHRFWPLALFEVETIVCETEAGALVFRVVFQVVFLGCTLGVQFFGLVIQIYCAWT